MHRLKLTWLGNEGNPGRFAATFRILATIAAVHFCINYGGYVMLFLFGFMEGFMEALMAYMSGEQTDGCNSDCETDNKNIDRFFAMVRLVLNPASFILFIVLLARTRYRIRSRYAIPERNCSGCEDCCCALWCTCCTVSQMARHTADYENYAALCCSETGLSPNSPLIV